MTRWPRWIRRGAMVNVATGFIVAGVLMMLQPFYLALYSCSFLFTLAGTVLFLIVSRFPE
jgi:hypothetical protein